MPDYAKLTKLSTFTDMIFSLVCLDQILSVYINPFIPTSFWLWPYWSNPPVYKFFDIQALCHSALIVAECQKIKNVVLNQYGPEHSIVLPFGITLSSISLTMLQHLTFKTMKNYTMYHNISQTNFTSYLERDLSEKHWQVFVFTVTCNSTAHYLPWAHTIKLGWPFFKNDGNGLFSLTLSTTIQHTQ